MRMIRRHNLNDSKEFFDFKEFLDSKGFFPTRRRRWVAVIGGAVIPIGLALIAAPAVAQGETKSSAEVSAQVDELAKQRGDLVNRLKGLKDRIDGATSVINKRADAANVAKDSIEELRAIVSPLLAAVADNGEISQLGVKALNNAINRKTALERDMRFTPDERQRLVAAWEVRIKATADANAELEKARAKFLQLMYTLQTKEDLIGEWAAIAAQDEVIAAIRDLTTALKETSVDVKNFIALLEGTGA
jgi:chromosome segregation ATPase